MWYQVFASLMLAATEELVVSCHQLLTLYSVE
jgi:hypothetical protein